MIARARYGRYLRGMKLMAWLTETGARPSALAHRIGVSPSTVKRWVDETTVPTMDHMGLITEITDGAVMPNDFMRANGAKHLNPQRVPKANGRPQRNRTDAGLLAAIEAAGTMSRLAAVCGVSPGAASHWRNIPEQHVEAVAFTFSIDRHTLRPDLYDDRGRRIAAAAE